MTRQEILSALNVLPTEKLEKLLKYSTSVMLPEEDLMTSVNFSQLVEKAHQLADIYFPEWTDRSAADFGQILVELFALFSEKDFYYINAFSRESFLLTAKDYSSVYLRGLALGHTPQLDTCSEVEVQIVHANALPATIPPGNLVLGLPSGNQLTNFESIQVAGASFITALQSGVYFSRTFSFTGKAIELTFPQISENHIRVVARGRRWNRVKSFAAVTSDAYAYMLVPKENGFRILFGNNVLGLRPEIGEQIEVSLMYQVNEIVTPSTVPSLSFRSIFAITSATNTGTVVQGKVRDSLDYLRTAISLGYSVGNNIINATDLKNALISYPGVVKATAYSIGSSLFYKAALNNGTFAGETFFAAFETLWKDRIVSGLTLAPLETTPIGTTITANAFIIAGYNREAIKLRIQEALVDYTDPIVLGDYGKSFILQDVYAYLLRNIEGLQNFQFITVNGTTPADILITDENILAKFDFSNPSNVILVS